MPIPPPSIPLVSHALCAPLGLHTRPSRGQEPPCSPQNARSCSQLPGEQPSQGGAQGPPRALSPPLLAGPPSLRHWGCDRTHCSQLNLNLLRRAGEPKSTLWFLDIFWLLIPHSFTQQVLAEHRPVQIQGGCQGEAVNKGLPLLRASGGKC